MKVTLKTNLTWPRHGTKVVLKGATIDVPDEVAIDWLKRDIAEKPGTPLPPVQPKEK